MEPRKEQFELDYTNVLVSLKCRPRNWVCNYPDSFTNLTEKISVQIGVTPWSATFRRADRIYGGLLNPLSILKPWCWRMHRAAVVARENPKLIKMGHSWAAHLAVNNLKDKIKTLMKGQPRGS